MSAACNAAHIISALDAAHSAAAVYCCGGFSCDTACIAAVSGLNGTHSDAVDNAACIHLAHNATDVILL